MDVFVYGAGVIGTVYAARLQGARNRVTVLARGGRLAEIRGQGLILEDAASGVRSTVQVATTERLGPDDRFDLALVTVRREQLADVMPALTANRRIPVVLFMSNNPHGPAEWVRALGRERVLLGFPGAGGIREGGVVRYALIAQQPTTVGGTDGFDAVQLRAVVEHLRAAGFPTRTERHMDAWLKTHAFFITAVGGALYLAGGDGQRLARDGRALPLMTAGVREGFAAVRTLGFPVTPFPLQVLFTWLPRTFAVRYWQRFFADETGDLVIGRHARAAPREMRVLADDCRVLLEQSGVRAPALAKLYEAIDTYAGRHHTNAGGESTTPGDER